MTQDDYLEVENDGKLILPSEMENKKKEKKIKNKQKEISLKRLKWISIGILALTIYVFYDQITLYFLNMLKLHPTIYNYYLLMESQIQNNTLKGLFFVSIFGSLFFLVLPSEALFIYYLSSTNHGAGTIMILTLIGCLIGFTINYFAGRILGERLVRILFKKNFEKYKEKINEYGGYVLLIGAILPGPIEVLAVFFGAFKFGYIRYIYLIFIGRFIKYALLFIAFIFFWDQIMGYYHNLIDSILILKNLYI